MDNDDPESTISSQESDSVDNLEDMEESCEDSDFLDLVSQGNESHPLVKFTRLVQNKKAELEYHYNPDVERNKGKDMKPLWEAAKNTVDGGMKELEEIITDRRKKNLLESETLKLEVVARDLQILSMKFEQHLTNKQKDEKFEVFKDYSAKTSDLNLGSVQNLVEKSLTARKKFTSEFFCSKSGPACRNCQETGVQQSAVFPCSFEKALKANIFEGVITKFAFLTCVRSKDPKLRELAITTFRDLLKFDKKAEEESGSDIQKMIGIHPQKIKTIVNAFIHHNTEIESGLFALLIDLLVGALKVVLKIAICHELESLVQSGILYQIETNLTESDSLVYDSIMDQDGLFGFISWFSKFLVTSLSENVQYLLPAEMFIFNLEVCSPLVKIFDFGSGSYPWFEALLMNFSKTFKSVWTRGLNQGEAQWAQVRDSFVRCSVQQKKVVLSQSVLPSKKKYEICGECRKRINKNPKLYPLCFQGSHFLESYPREIARMERPPAEWCEDVSSIHMDTRRRSVVLVCGPRCMLKAMSQMNPPISEIIHKIIPSITNGSYNGLSEDQLDEMQKYYVTQIENVIIKIKYFNLRTVVETVFPPFGVKIVGGTHLEFEMKHYVRKKTIITMKHRDSSPPDPARSRLPSPDITKQDNLSGQIPGRIRDYFENLLLHKKKNVDCSHHQVWGGWAKYHPLDNFTKYVALLDQEGVSKTTIDFQLRLETCGQIDLKMMKQAGRQELMKRVMKFKDRTLHLFSIHLLDSQAEFLREQTNKLVVNGPSNHDDVALDKVFSSNVKCLLGLWESGGEDVSQGILICQSPNTYFAFVPRSFPNFFDFLTFGIGMKVVWPFVRSFTNALVQNVPKCIQFDFPKTDLTEIEKKRVTESIYGFGILNIITLKKKFQDIILSDAGMGRFKDIHQTQHEGAVERLSQEENLLVRFHAKHLVGCKHEMKWKGSMNFCHDLPSPDMMIFQKSSCSAWAFQCRSCLESLSGSREPATIPQDFWSLMKSFMFVLLIKDNLDPQICQDKHTPTIVLELGSVQRDVIEFMKRSDTTVLSFLSNDREPRNMKYLIKYFFHNGKMMGKIFDSETETFQVVGRSLQSQSWTQNTFCREFFGVVGSTPDERKSECEGDEGPEAAGLFEKLLQYQCSALPPVNLLQTLGNVLWTGEMQTFLISNQPVRGFKKAEEYCKMSKHAITETIGYVEQEDLGSTRNCPFLAPTGHYVYSNYVAITGADTADLHFKRCGETAVSLIAFNVERKVVENIIGTFKKCFVYNLHIQDVEYLYSELKDTKTTMLTFLLEKDELVRDVLKISPTEFAERFFILKFDHRESVIKAYFPKEKDKMIQIWKCVTKTNLMSSHEKMFRKIKKPDRSLREATATVSVTNLTSVHLEGTELTNTHYQKVEITLNEKPKKSQEKKAKDDKSDTSIELSQNLKKMFTPSAASAGDEGEVEAEKEKEKSRQKKVRVCWTCQASSDCEGVTLLKCEGCRRARYCGAECQAEDWDTHREFCQAAQERRAARHRNSS